MKYIVYEYTIEKLLNSLRIAQTTYQSTWASQKTKDYAKYLHEIFEQELALRNVWSE